MPTAATSPESCRSVSPDEALAARLREQIAILVGSRSVMTLLVTHNLDDAVRLGDRIFFLSARPARIVHVETIRTSRPQRSEADVNETKADLLRLDLANL